MIKQFAASIIAFGLIGSANATEGFAPWNDRIRESDYTVMDTRADNGFAPWDKRNVEAEAITKSVQFEISDTGFRPWAQNAS